MAHAAHAHSGDHGGSGHSHHGPSYYVKIWGLLLALLIASILGPMLGNKILTIITAFGIAVVKALIVASFFMHLNVEKRYIWYLLVGMLAMLFLFFFGVAADVMKFDGRNWTKPVATKYAEDFAKLAGHHGGDDEDEAAGGEGHQAGAPAAQHGGG